MTKKAVPAECFNYVVNVMGYDASCIKAHRIVRRAYHWQDLYYALLLQTDDKPIEEGNPWIVLFVWDGSTWDCTEDSLPWEDSLARFRNAPRAEIVG